MTAVAEDLEEVLGVLVRLASGDYAARGVPSGSHEDFAALMLGVNMLAEELEASRTELERRVESRTATLARLNRDVVALADFSKRLQRCGTTLDAHTSARGIGAVLSGVSGALYLRTEVPHAFAQLTAWGPYASTQAVLEATACGVDHTTPPGEAGLPAGPAVGAHELPRPGTVAEASWCVPLSTNGQLFGFLRLDHVEEDVQTAGSGGGGMIHLATAAAEILALALANLDLREGLWTQAMRDPLTGLYNRRYVDEWSACELSRTDRSCASLGVILVDIDRFKLVNDEHGHEVGDQVLVAVASVLQGALRPEDVACRYGGEEFVMLLSVIDRDTLLQRAEDIRARVAGMREHHGGLPLPAVTISVGFALYPQHGPSLDHVLAAADTALYRAKQNGRNRVESAG